MACGVSKDRARALGGCGPPPRGPPLTFLIISLGQPQGNPLGCTPLVANGSGHPSELGSTRRAGNGALGGPKAHRKLQTHPSLASQGSKKGKSSTKSAASQIPLQAQEGKHPVPPLPGRGLRRHDAAAFSPGCSLEVQSQPHPRPTGSEPLGRAQETGLGMWPATPGG